MKWSVTYPRLAETTSTFEVEVPDEFRRGLPSVGQKFKLRVRPMGEELPGEWSAQICQFVGDGRSLQIGHRIIRLVSLQMFKKGKGRFRASLASPASDFDISLKPIRPVEPKLTAAALGGGVLKSPMTGKVLKVLVANGQNVQEGQTLVVIEAMKMENQIKAECTGLIEDIRVTNGQSVSVEAPLMTLHPALEENR